MIRWVRTGRINLASSEVPGRDAIAIVAAVAVVRRPLTSITAVAFQTSLRLSLAVQQQGGGGEHAMITIGGVQAIIFNSLLRCRCRKHTSGESAPSTFNRPRPVRSAREQEKSRARRVPIAAARV